MIWILMSGYVVFIFRPGCGFQSLLVVTPLRILTLQISQARSAVHRVRGTAHLCPSQVSPYPRQENPLISSSFLFPLPLPCSAFPLAFPLRPTSTSTQNHTYTAKLPLPRHPNPQNRPMLVSQLLSALSPVLHSILLCVFVSLGLGRD